MEALSPESTALGVAGAAPRQRVEAVVSGRATRGAQAPGAGTSVTLCLR